MFLRNPSIEVTHLKQVIVSGSVTRPGLFPVDPTVTVGDVLALAGGVTVLGDPNKIQLIRDGRIVEANLGQDLRLSDAALRSNDQIFIPERGWFARNTAIVAAGITGVASIAVALLVRR